MLRFQKPVLVGPGVDQETSRHRFNDSVSIVVDQEGEALREGVFERLPSGNTVADSIMSYVRLPFYRRRASICFPPHRPFIFRSPFEIQPAQPDIRL